MAVTRLARGVGKNVGVKIIALVVVLVIWYHAAGQKETDRTLVAALEFVNVPDSLTVTGRVPTEVEINVTDTHLAMLSMGWKRLAVHVNMSRAVPGRFSQRLAVSDVVFPRGMEPRKVRIVAPVIVDVVLERVTTRRVRVAVALSGSLQGDQLLSSVPEATPDWVLVTGPENLVASIEKIPTASIDLGKLKESVQREVELDFDRGVFKCDPERVTVTIPVSDRGRRLLANIPPTTLMDNEDLSAQVYPKTVSLTLEGPTALLDTLTSGDVSVLVDLSGKSTGSYTLAPEVIVPDGVEKYVMDVDSLRIIINRTPQPQ
jgi:YbbR domain-containing protein